MGLGVEAKDTLRAQASWLRDHATDLVGIIVPALLLGTLAIHNLGATSFWRDEISSVVFAHASVGDLLTILGRERRVAGLPNMATYYLILHFWLALGETEARVRFLSVLAGVATVVPIYFTARRVGGWVAGATAGAVFAVIPYVVHHSQDARGYSMSMLAAATLTWLLMKATERQTVGWWATYGVVAALGLYVHFFVALIIGAHGIWVLATRQVPPWRSLLAALVPLGIAIAPIPSIILQYGGKHGWVDALTFRRFALSVSELAGGPAAVAAFIVAFVVVVAIRRRDPLVWLLAATILLPIAVAAAFSTVKPLFVPRYLIVVLPAIATTVGIGIASIRPLPLRLGAGVAVAAILVPALPTAYPALDRQDWRSASGWIAQEVAPDDRFIVPVGGRRELEYYLGRHGFTLPGSLDVASVVADVDASRVWVLVTEADETGSIRDAMGTSFELVDDRSWGPRIRILLYAPPSASG